ncbi:hypothetical protein HF520_10575 [Romboutsia sp. CE17]|uniref:hypothetical protein n=1 Tax=Romboutsia sp. CE17 TaxID=2724150 RepID=UPI001442E4E3|nr:hypothetical protein [Romboutsia sp. CE17]QJA09374.1 hypothetical protein HF520_10575 [Romboutsia sp. CE17]
MKKMFRSMILSMVLVLTLVTSAFANPVNDIRNELLSIGVPKNYVANIVEYLQKTTITDAQYENAMSYVNKAKAIIGNESDLRQLSTSQKNELQSLAISAGKVLGLNVQFSKNSQGKTVVSVTDSKGGTLLQLSTVQVMDLVTNFEMEVIIDLLESVVEFSNNPEKGEYSPTGGELNQTATGYGNMMLLGAALVALAGGVFTYSKRQFA